MAFSSKGRERCGLDPLTDLVRVNSFDPVWRKCVCEQEAVL